jgi:hypothetical protein
MCRGGTELLGETGVVVTVVVVRSPRARPGRADRDHRHCHDR